MLEEPIRAGLERPSHIPPNSLSQNVFDYVRSRGLRVVTLHEIAKPSQFRRNHVVPCVRHSLPAMMVNPSFLINKSKVDCIQTRIVVPIDMGKIASLNNHLPIESSGGLGDHLADIVEKWAIDFDTVETIEVNEIKAAIIDYISHVLRDFFE
jgi:hypothetical protein